MHELGLTQQIVELAEQRAAGARVRRIVLEIGQLSGVLPDAVRFCFDVCSRQTPTEGAELVILEPPGLARCRRCLAEFALEQPYGVCACGSTELQWLSGDELRLKELETF